MECLREYENRTAKFRVAKTDSPNSLFLSYLRPHKPISSQRIANWIKDLLSQAGVDLSFFKAHSARGASATAAFNKGVTIENILQAADWSTDSTFRRFYYRPSHSAVYGQKVLQPASSENPKGELLESC